MTIGIVGLGLIGGSMALDLVADDQSVVTWDQDPVTIKAAQRVGIATADSVEAVACLLYTSPSPRDGLLSRMPSSA